MSRTILTALALIALVGCGKKGADTAAADSLNRDLQLAPADSGAKLNDQPASQPQPAPQPAAPAPAPAPKPVVAKPAAPKPPATLTVAAGTQIQASSNDSLHSRHDKPGKTITANVSYDVTDANGKVAIPAGSVVTLEVVELEPAGNTSAKDGKIVLKATSVNINGKSYAIAGTVGSIEHTLVGQGVTAGGAARVGGGAAVGAIAGKIIGGRTGAVIGGVVGAGAGTVAAVKTADRDVVVAPGAAVVLTLDQNVIVAS